MPHRRIRIGCTFTYAASALPDDTLIYTLPSRYCLPDALGNEAWSRFGGLPPGYRRVGAGGAPVTRAAKARPSADRAKQRSVRANP